MNDYRLLIVSNNCLSKHNSNGRTLLNLLGNIKRGNIYQIYVSGELSDFSFCADFLRITNSDVIKAYFCKKPVNNQSPPEGKTEDVNLGSKKNALTMLLRDLAWDCNLIIKKYVLNWAKEKKPDAVLLQLGDNTLLIHLAVIIAKNLNIPLITYNTEDYYFKNYDFIKKEFKAGVIYKLYHKRFCSKFKKMMLLEPSCVYNCEGLAEVYDKEFGTKSTVVLPSADITPAENSEQKGIVYAGNLGVGRHISLIEIGEALYEIDESLYLDVYGRANEQVQQAFKTAKGLKHHGFIDYEQNCEIIKNAKLLIHTESFDDFFAVDTRFAFSTKLADYCATGNPMFVYAPENCESMNYLKKYNAAFNCTQKENLKEILKSALFDEEERKAVCLRAKELAAEKNNKEENYKKFEEVFISSVKRG